MIKKVTKIEKNIQNLKKLNNTEKIKKFEKKKELKKIEKLLNLEIIKKKNPKNLKKLNKNYKNQTEKIFSTYREKKNNFFNINCLTPTLVRKCSLNIEKIHKIEKNIKIYNSSIQKKKSLSNIKNQEISNSLIKFPKLKKKHVLSYYQKNILNSIKNYITKNKKDNFFSHFKKNFENFQILNKYEINKRTFIYPLNINLSFFNHKIKKKRYLILDMDETLIHSSSKKLNDSSIKIEKNLFINKRPYLKNFLENLSKIYNIIIFTCSEESYANSILNNIDSENKFFFLKFFREDCLFINNNVYLKNLEFINNLNFEKCVLVDNSPLHFYRNLENTVPILPFYGDEEDSELLKLEVFLKDLVKIKDFRKGIDGFFFLKKFCQEENFEVLVKKIYEDYSL